MICYSITVKAMLLKPSHNCLAIVLVFNYNYNCLTNVLLHKPQSQLSGQCSCNQLQSQLSNQNFSTTWNILLGVASYCSGCTCILLLRDMSKIIKIVFATVRLRYQSCVTVCFTRSPARFWSYIHTLREEVTFLQGKVCLVFETNTTMNLSLNLQYL